MNLGKKNVTVVKNRGLDRELNDETQQLLSFASKVNKDICFYFGGKTILTEDHLLPENQRNIVSGREMYCADLLRIANNENCGLKNKIIAKDELVVQLERNAVGADPFLDLFKIGTGTGTGYDNFSEVTDLGEQRLLGTYSDLTHCHGGHRATTNSNRISKRTLSWKERNLPKSFFREPCSKML